MYMCERACVRACESPQPCLVHLTNHSGGRTAVRAAGRPAYRTNPSILINRGGQRVNFVFTRLLIGVPMWKWDIIFPNSCCVFTCQASKMHKWNIIKLQSSLLYDVHSTCGQIKHIFTRSSFKYVCSLKCNTVYLRVRVQQFGSCGHFSALWIPELLISYLIHQNGPALAGHHLSEMCLQKHVFINHFPFSV